MGTCCGNLWQSPELIRADDTRDLARIKGLHNRPLGVSPGCTQVIPGAPWQLPELVEEGGGCCRWGPAQARHG